MATGIQVVFDCTNPDREAEFWAEALHYILQPPPEGYADWETWLREHGMQDALGTASAIVDPDKAGPRVYFQKVPEPKTVKNRVHFDLNVGGGRDTPPEEHRQRVDAEVERLIGLGAKKLRVLEEHGEYYTVMQDPEGNEFCVQ
jgi:hypothetical protein